MSVLDAYSRRTLCHARLPATPVQLLDVPGAEVFVKLESANPSGSAKERSASWIMARAIRCGRVTRRTTVVESSSGNFAVALARICRSLDLRFVPVIDPNTNVDTVRLLKQLCIRVELVEQPDANGSFLPARLRRVRQISESHDDCFWPDQYSNPDAAEAHYELTGRELCDQVGRLDYVFVGVGTGATITGVARRVKESFEKASVVAVDVVGSAIFGDSPAPRRIPGIGSAIVPAILDRSVIDHVTHVGERDAVLACRELMQRHGLFTGGSTGSVFHAVERWVRQADVRARTGSTLPRIAFISADGGGPYLDTVYNSSWVAHQELHAATAP